MRDHSAAAIQERPARPARARFRVVTVAVVALSVVLIVIVGVVATSAAGCSACHATQAQAFASSPHAGLACTVCHAASPEQASARLDVVLRMVPRAIGGVRLARAGRPIGSSACMDCHEAVLSGGVASKNGLRIDHEACASSVQCASCHSVVSHGSSTRIVRASSMAECTSCHLTKGASTVCKVCHEGEMPADRVRDPVWVRTHGPDWEKAHGLGDLRTCAVCHKPDDCTQCHGSGVPHPADFGGTHGEYAMKTGEAKCLTCHKQAAFCEGCHQIEMPHPRGFLQSHSSIAESQDDPACTRCHPLEDCKTCHGYHVHPGGTLPPVGKYGKG